MNTPVDKKKLDIHSFINIDESVRQKYLNLCSILSEMQEVMIAFSAGVDSTFLLKVAVDVLGHKASSCPFRHRTLTF